MGGIEYDKVLRTKDHLKSRSPIGPVGATGATGPAGLGLIDVTWAAANALEIGGTVVPGVYYRITDRFNGIFQGMNINRMEPMGKMSIPFGTTPYQAGDEEIEVGYTVSTDTVGYWKDERLNIYDQTGIPFFVFVAILNQVQFGNAQIVNNKAYVTLPNFSGLTTGFVVGNTADNGSLTVSGNGNSTGNTLTSGGSATVSDNANLSQSTVANNSSITASLNCTVNGAQVRTFSVLTVTDNAVLLGYESSAMTTFSMSNFAIATALTMKDKAVGTMTGGTIDRVSIEHNNSFLMTDGLLMYEKIIGGGFTQTGVGTFTIGNEEFNGTLIFQNGAFVADGVISHSLITFDGCFMAEPNISFMNVGTTTFLGTSHTNKTFFKGYSNFDITLPIDGLTTIDLTTHALGLIAGIVNLTSANALETITKENNGQTIHDVHFFPEAGLQVDLTPISILAAVVNDIVLDTGAVTSVGRAVYGESFVLRKDAAGYARQVDINTFF